MIIRSTPRIVRQNFDVYPACYDRCRHCGEPLEHGDPYWNHGAVDNGRMATLSLHVECDDVLREAGYEEYEPRGDNEPRGRNVGRGIATWTRAREELAARTAAKRAGKAGIAYGERRASAREARR